MSHNQSNFKRWLNEFSIPLVFGVIVALVMANVAPEFHERLISTPVYELFSGSDEQAHHADEAHPNATTTVETSHTEAASHDDHGKSAMADQTEHHGVAVGAAHSDASHHIDETSKSDSHAEAEHTETQHTDSAHPESKHDDAEHAAVAGGHGDSAHHGWGHYFTLHFLINDLFMVLFFGIAAKEITEACLPNGALNPVSKAINPLLATLGGVIGPVAVYLCCNQAFGDPAWARGWGIPTATDIALAWMVARLIFGKSHPAISFLLLLAVADDAIGLGIIAVAYPDPAHPTEWLNALWIVPGMITVFAFRKMGVRSWIPYVLIGGAISWWGLFSAHLHPALALVFIVPFIPGPNVDFGLFRDSPDRAHHHDSPLELFEHQTRTFVDCGLFLFALVNAGVSFDSVTSLTWIVFLALFVGKTLGVTLFSWAGQKCGFPLPAGMDVRHLVVVGCIAGLGLTVALFVSAQAFTEPLAQGAAKMGALFSVLVALIAFVLAKVLGVSKSSKPRATASGSGALSGAGIGMGNANPAG